MSLDQARMDAISRWFERFEENIGQLVASTATLSAGVAAHTQRIDSVERNYQSLDDKRTMDYKELSTRITTVQTDLTEKMAENTQTVITHVDEALGKFRDERRASDAIIHKRLRVLERWRWLIIGGGIVALFVITAILIKLGNIVLTLLSAH